MRSPLELASVCEEGTTPDRKLELEIWRMNGGTCPPGHKPLDWLHCYTSQVSAALDLCSSREAPDVMHEAVSRIGTRFHLHITFWPEGVSYAQVLARFVTAAALRRIDERRRKETGEDIDLAYVELEPHHLSVARTWHTADDNLVAKAGLDERPMARIWDALVKELLRDEVLFEHPGKATDEMIIAGQAAYDRKNDDRWSLSPTEEPDAGGGPIGYAWRAMAKARKTGITA